MKRNEPSGIACLSCGHVVDGSKTLCPVCGTRIQEPDPVEDTIRNIPVPAVADPDIPIGKGLLMTFGALVRHPFRFFSEKQMRTPILRPLLFAVVVRYLFYLLAVGTDWLMTGIAPPMLAYAGGLMDVVAEMFILGGILHLALWLLSAGPGGFTVTFNTLAYTRIVAVFSPLPVVGWFVYALLAFLYPVAALARAHKVPAWRTLLAVMLPGLLLCLLVAMIQNAR